MSPTGRGFLPGANQRNLFEGSSAGRLRPAGSACEFITIGRDNKRPTLRIQEAGSVPLDGEAGEEGDQDKGDQIPSRMDRWSVSAHGMQDRWAYPCDKESLCRRGRGEPATLWIHAKVKPDFLNLT